MGRIFWRIVLSLIIAAAGLYIEDVAQFVFRKDKTATVTVRPYYAVPRKDKKEEYMFDDPQDQTCANSIFPHQGMPPCWYLRRHPEKRINL